MLSLGHWDGRHLRLWYILRPFLSPPPCWLLLVPSLLVVARSPLFLGLILYLPSRRSRGTNVFWGSSWDYRAGLPRSLGPLLPSCPLAILVAHCMQQ